MSEAKLENPAATEGCAPLAGSEFGRRALDRMTDVTRGHRLLLIWAWSHRWTIRWCEWGFRVGPLWVQWTPPTIDEALDRRLASIPNTEVNHE